MIKKHKTIFLSPDDILAKGKARTCYQHPDRLDICIKIDHAEYRRHKDTLKEAAYYKRIAFLKRSDVFGCIPRFYGLVETSLGVGGSFELIRDHTTGQISRVLDQISLEELGRRYVEISAAFDNLIHSMFDQGIVVCDPHPGNIVVQELEDGSVRLVFIDGIGHRNAIPAVDFFKYLANKKLKRIMRRQQFSRTIKLMADAKAAGGHL